MEANDRAVFPGRSRAGDIALDIKVSCHPPRVGGDYHASTGRGNQETHVILDGSRIREHSPDSVEPVKLLSLVGCRASTRTHIGVDLNDLSSLRIRTVALLVRGSQAPIKQLAKVVLQQGVIRPLGGCYGTTEVKNVAGRNLVGKPPVGTYGVEPDLFASEVLGGLGSEPATRVNGYGPASRVHCTHSEDFVPNLEHSSAPHDVGVVQTGTGKTSDRHETSGVCTYIRGQSD